MKRCLFLAAVLLPALHVFAQGEYKVTPKGMYYKIVPTGNGVKVPQNGVVRFYIEQRVNDSIIFSSFGKGLSVMALSKPGNNPDEHAYIMKQMCSGDSVVTLNLADDLMKNKELVLPDFIHPGDSLFQSLRIVDAFASVQAFEAFRTKEKNTKLAADQKTIEAWLKENRITGAKKTKLGCYMQVLKKGTGSPPAKGSKVAIRYTGKHLDGTIFDDNESSPSTQPLLEFNVGTGQMIAGFDEAALSLPKGGRCRIYVPAVNAYGEAGSGDAIRPNEILMFELEMVKFTPPKKPAGPKITITKKYY